VTIVVATYDPDWVAQFERERAALERALARWLCTPVEHIGSTSIPGLAAKPILDMIAGVTSLDDAKAAIGPLTALGYVHAEHRPRALWFYRPAEGERTHHLHLTEPGSDIWRERLAFRDAVRADPRLVDEYQALKQQLATEHPDDVGAYTAGKRTFVGSVLAGAGVVLSPH
jgi:GrpB-like predicted nucleotidyltransferase (UPF0157 family)